MIRYIPQYFIDIWSKHKNRCSQRTAVFSCYSVVIASSAISTPSRKPRAKSASLSNCASVRSMSVFRCQLYMRASCALLADTFDAYANSQNFMKGEKK